MLALVFIAISRLGSLLSVTPKSIGREVAFEALPAVEAPLMAWVEDIRSENERRHLSQFIVEV